MAQCELGYCSLFFPLLFDLSLAGIVSRRLSAARHFSKSGKLATIKNEQILCCKKSRIKSIHAIFISGIKSSWIVGI